MYWPVLALRQVGEKSSWKHASSLSCQCMKQFLYPIINPCLECSVRRSVIVGHEEFVEPLHELKVILKSSLDKSVHLHGFVDVKLGKCGLKQFKILDVFMF